MRALVASPSIGFRCRNRPWLTMASGFLMLVCAAPADAQAVTEVASATVSRLSGTVQIVRSGVSKVAYLNAPLLPGDTVRTEKNGSAELSLAGAGAVRAESDTEVKLPGNKDKTVEAQESLQLLKGRLFLNIDAAAVKKQGKREFRLKTPAAILAVKGTKFFVLSSAAGDIVGVHEGAVSVSDSLAKQTRRISAGNVVEASAGKLSEPPTFRRFGKSEHRAVSRRS